MSEVKKQLLPRFLRLIFMIRTIVIEKTEFGEAFFDQFHYFRFVKSDADDRIFREMAAIPHMTRIESAFRHFPRIEFTEND